MAIPKIPAFVSWLQWLSPAKYTLQALAILQFEGSRLELILDQGELRYPASISANLAVLAAMFAIVVAATAIALERKREKR